MRKTLSLRRTCSTIIRRPEAVDFLVPGLIFFGQLLLRRITSLILWVNLEVLDDPRGNAEVDQRGDQPAHPGRGQGDHRAVLEEEMTAHLAGRPPGIGHGRNLSG
jgi:hypothetical protein